MLDRSHLLERLENMKFRLNKFQIEDEEFTTDEIQLVDENKSNATNYFSLIVGNNGTGKSRLLGSIVKALTGKFKSRNSNLFFFSKFDLTTEPSKVIALSNSMSDKFPMDNLFNHRKSRDDTYSSQKYNYLGTRGGMGSSTRQLMRKAIDILLENYANKKIAKSYRHVFNYLDYKPVIKLEYKVIQKNFGNKKNTLITPRDILKYIDDAPVNSSIRYRQYETFKERYSDKLPEICDFLNKMRLNEQRTYSLTINFSNDNIQKLTQNKNTYNEEQNIYEILNLLRKLNMIRGFEVKVFKNSHDEFNFGDASSGESSIFTTLISLIPLVQDNCCVLIDEPEISLHPSWQYRYIELLSNIFQNYKGCHIIIASHSHFIVSDLPINNSSVITLRKKEGKVTSKLLNDSTFAWSAEDILLNIFDMPTTRNRYISSTVTKALELLGEGKKESKIFREIVSELSVVADQLNEDDPLKTVISTIIAIN